LVTCVILLLLATTFLLPNHPLLLEQFLATLLLFLHLYLEVVIEDVHQLFGLVVELQVSPREVSNVGRDDLGRMMSQLVIALYHIVIIDGVGGGF